MKDSERLKDMAGYMNDWIVPICARDHMERIAARLEKFEEIAELWEIMRDYEDAYPERADGILEAMECAEDIREAVVDLLDELIGRPE